MSDGAEAQGCRATQASVDSLSACTLGANSDPYDRITQNLYDEASELTQVKVAVGTSDAATEGTLTYTHNGKLQTLKDAENNLSTFEYDGFDRLQKTRYPDATKGSGTSSTTDFEQLTYDANSNLYTLRVRSGDTINYRYDALNRLTLKDSTVLPATTYAYDNLGRLTSGIFNASGRGVTNSYDALSRLTSTTSSVDGTSRALSYLYDAAGRRKRITWPDGFHADYTRLVTGELSSVTENAGTSGSVLLATYGYDDIGNLTSATYGNGTNQTYTYDTLSRLKTLQTGTASDLLETFAYSPASQISSVVRSNTAYSFTGYATGSTPTTTNGLNEMAAVNGVTYTNDTNDNLSSDGTSTYHQDAENKLTAVTATGVSANVSYDPLGRLSQVTGSTVADRTFLQDPATGAGGDAVVAEYSSGGGLQHRYVPLGLGAPLVDYDNTGARSWLMTDERGSVIASANDSGTITAINAYDEYGIPQATNSGRFQYAGQMWLSEVSLYSMRNRMYGTQWGRFIQPDPIGYAGGINIYEYAGSDPVNAADPLGLTPVVNSPGDQVMINCIGYDFCPNNWTVTGKLTPGFIPYSIGRPGSPNGALQGGRGSPASHPKTKPKPTSPAPCSVTQQDSANTGAISGSTLLLPEYTNLGIRLLRGTAIRSVIELAGVEATEGALAVLGGPVTLGALAIGGSVYAYDRYSGGEVTRFFNRQLANGNMAIGAGCK